MQIDILVLIINKNNIFWNETNFSLKYFKNRIKF